ncbi:MAG: lipopolysaccharide kinase InaA family protein [Thermodesulfobacteriota bacterium]
MDASRPILPVSGNFRRMVYSIQTDSGIFFLKYSPVQRKKDRLRFLALPWRIGTEWRNLARLRKKGIAAPRRILFGYRGLFPNLGFFLVTREVPGATIDRRNPDQVLALAAFMAGLHERGVFHRDIHPDNILMDHNGTPTLLDVQEVYFLPWLPRRLKISNLGQLWWHICSPPGGPVTLEAFLQAYNTGENAPVSAAEVEKAADRRQQRYYRSRDERCCKNSTEFQVIRNGSSFRGFKRRDFAWGKAELQIALDRGKQIKGENLLVHEAVCVKIHKKRLFHRDRSLTGWKMSRALAIRGIGVPVALAYFVLPEFTCLLSVFYGDGLRLNDYFSTSMSGPEKKAAIRRLAGWLRTCHDLNIWQRDFKSSNVLVVDGQFMMVDLESVKICRKISPKRELINLAQLNASLSHRLTIKDRLRFFHSYYRNALPPRRERRRAYQTIWRITRGKNTLPFGLDPEKIQP